MAVLGDNVNIHKCTDTYLNQIIVVVKLSIANEILNVRNVIYDLKSWQTVIAIVIGVKYYQVWIWSLRHCVKSYHRNVSVIQCNFHHRHCNFSDDYRFRLNWIHHSRLDSTHHFHPGSTQFLWIDSTPIAWIYFWFESEHLSPITVKIQGFPYRPECLENISTAKSWNIPILRRLKFVLMRTLYFLQKNRRDMERTGNNNPSL